MNYIAEFYDNAGGKLLLKGQTPGNESVYAGMKSGEVGENGEANDAGLERTRLRNTSVTPNLLTPDRAVRSGSEVSANGKRPREADDHAELNGNVNVNVNGNGNGNGAAPHPTTNGTGSRVPAAARELPNGDSAAKRQRVEDGSAVQVGNDDAGSEEGEVEE